MDKVLIANREGITCRIIQKYHDTGISIVAVFSEADKIDQHVQLADGAHAIGPSQPQESYFDGAGVLAASTRAEVRFVHPGYGILSKSATVTTVEFQHRNMMFQ